MYIGQAPGLGQRSVFRFVSTANQSTISGRDLDGLVLTYTPGRGNHWLFIDGSKIGENDYDALDGSTIKLRNGKVLPAGLEIIVVADSPFSLADTYRKAETDALIRRRNLIVNPAMQINQENLSGTTLTGLYTVDQWRVDFAGITGVATAQIPSITPSGSPMRSRVRATVAKATLAADDYITFRQNIEGFAIVPLKWGTPDARPAVLRFGVNLPAGTWPVAIRNGVSNLIWRGAFTIAAEEAGKDVTKVFNIPAQASGAWPVDNTLAAVLVFTLSAGSNFQGALGWQPNGAVGLNGQSNLAAVANNAFELFDVGLYEGTVLPPFEVPDYGDEERRCRRYWEARTVTTRTTASTAPENHQSWEVEKRAPPTLTVTFDAGTGATFITLKGTKGFFQQAAHSAINQATVVGNARL